VLYKNLVNQAMAKQLINHIKEYRNRSELTQEDLANVVGVSRQTIISIERGRYMPSLPLALKFASFFGCPTDELFERR
jgi:putative transcriptional regulator